MQPETIRIAIVDDDAADRRVLEEILEEYGRLRKLKLSCAAYASGEAFLAGYIPFSFRLVCMDVYMEEGKLDGVQTALALRERDHRTGIVFITTSEYHRKDAFSVHAYDYLEKPLEKEQVFHLLDGYLEPDAPQLPALGFICEHKEIKLPYKEVVFVRTGQRNYLEILDASGVLYQTRLTFSSVQELLREQEDFLRINRGVIVNLHYIRDIKDGNCLIGSMEENAFSLPLKVRDAARLKTVWQNHVFDRMRRASGVFRKAAQEKR